MNSKMNMIKKIIWKLTTIKIKEIRVIKHIDRAKIFVNKVETIFFFKVFIKYNVDTPAKIIDATNKIILVTRLSFFADKLIIEYINAAREMQISIIDSIK